MVIDEFIAQLVKLRQAHGAELEVVTKTSGLMGIGVKKAPLPRIAHVWVDQPRRLFAKDDLDKNRGGKVVLL